MGSVDRLLDDKDLEATSADRTLAHLFRYPLKGEKKSIRAMMIEGVLVTAKQIAREGVTTKEQAQVLKEVFVRTDPPPADNSPGTVTIRVEEADGARPWSSSQNTTTPG